MNVRLYIWQRATAAIMAPLVVVHIAVIFYATRQGLSAADVLSRTRGSIAWAAFYGLFVIAVSIHASIGLRNVLHEWSPLGERRAGACAIVVRVIAGRARHSCRGRRGAAVTARHLKHRGSTLWLAAMVHRISGLALAIFLPLHFLALGLAIEGEARFENFLRWTDRPLVKFAEVALVFLFTVHLLGGLRVLLIENLDWRGGQKQLATLAAAVSAMVAFAFLVRVF